MEDIFLRDQVTGNETDREFAGYTIIDKGNKTGNQCSEQPPSSHLRAGTPRVWTRFVGGPWQREFDKYRGMKGRNG